MSTNAEIVSLRQRHNILKRHYGPDSAQVTAARRALALARTEHRIREAIEQAPPLDADTLARLRSLIPAAPASSGERHAA